MRAASSVRRLVCERDCTLVSARRYLRYASVSAVDGCRVLFCGRRSCILAPSSCRFLFFCECACSLAFTVAFGLPAVGAVGLSSAVVVVAASRIGVSR